jgi:hypothetical protein
MHTPTKLGEKIAWMALMMPCAFWATLDVEKQESAKTL